MLTHSPNFVWVNGAKVNTASLAHFKQSGVVFVSKKRAFTLRYLQYHEKLLFHSFSTATGIDWVTKETFADRGRVREEFCDRLQETSPRRGVVGSSSARRSATLLGRSWTGTITMPCSHHLARRRSGCS